jgi:hypothetical protein
VYELGTVEPSQKYTHWDTVIDRFPSIKGYGILLGLQKFSLKGVRMARLRLKGVRMHACASLHCAEHAKPPAVLRGKNKG